MRRTLLFALALSFAALTGQAAAEGGDWLLRMGITNIDPDDDGGNLNGTTDTEFEVDNAASLTIEGTYFLDDNFAVELLAAYPFEHDIDLGGSGIGETKQLPPTLSLQYHWTRWGNFKPYIGLGLNYTYFWDEDTEGALEGADLDLDNSWGMAYQVGVDYFINDKWFVNAVVRHIRIETDADVNGADAGNVKIDPWLIGAHVGYRF